MNETVLVTGASGFVGQHCVVELLKNGFKVRGSLRDLSRGEEVIAGVKKEIDPGLNLEFCRLDLLSDDGWDEAMRGCSYVLHVASPFIMAQPKDENDLIAPAREGSLRVLAAAKRAGVKRVVLTSSVVSMSAHMKEGSFDEESWTDLNASKLNAYTRSKTIAEQAAWDYIDAQTGPDQLEMAVINPGVILGPTLTSDLGGVSMTLMKQMITGEMSMVPKAGNVMVDVRDVAKLQVRAMLHENGNGRRFIAAGQHAHEFVEVAKILKSHGYDKTSTRLAPSSLLRVMSLFNAEAKGLVPYLGRHVDCDNSQTRSMLEWTPIPFEKTILDTAASIDGVLAEVAV